MASDQLWGQLVKTMTKKIEVPRIGGQGGSSARPLDPDDLTEDTTSQAPRYSGGSRPSSPEEAMVLLSQALDAVPKSSIERYLDQHGDQGGPVARRLEALGAVPSTSHRAGITFWWQALSEGWVDLEVLAEVLRTCPGMPASRDAAGPLFDFLLDAEAGTYKEVKAAAATALEQGKRLIQVLVEDGVLTPGRAADLAGEYYGLRRRRGKKWEADPNQRSMITPELAEAFDVVPMTGGDDDDTLTLLALDDPGSVLREPLGRMTHRKIQLLVDTGDRFAETQKEWLDAARAASASGKGRSRSESGRSQVRAGGGLRLDQDSFAGITYVPDMVQAILERATAARATDIHLEPQEGRLRVRFRLDGILHDVTNLSASMGEDVISRIKVMADMDITERRKPQDGHVHQMLGGEPFDFRIGTVPSSRGERMAIRITAASKEVPSLEVLGLEDWEEVMIIDFTKRSHGIVLACGPVGSGKTTTLYASIGEIDAGAKNIMTIEDPVEIELPNVTQVPVNYKLGVDFSAGLRALLRQDPNCILVGEVRDDETAKVAVRASLTGLLVYSTIHANSSPGAVTTLYNFDIPPFLLATSLVGVIAQRLLRTICPNCDAQIEPEQATLDQAGLPPTGTWVNTRGEVVEAPAEGAEPPEGAHQVVYRRGRGCDHCYGTGYSGRTGIFEILDVDEDIRHAITERAPEAKIRELALARGMKTLADSGRRRVMDGLTTADEFIRVLYQ